VIQQSETIRDVYAWLLGQLETAGWRLVLPLSITVGAGFLDFADVVARTALAPAELPIGVVTAFFGAPFFALVVWWRWFHKRPPHRWI